MTPQQLLTLTRLCHAWWCPTWLYERMFNRYWQRAQASRRQCYDWRTQTGDPDWRINPNGLTWVRATRVQYAQALGQGMPCRVGGPAFVPVGFPGA